MVYAPFAFLNLLCRVIAIIYGFWHIALPALETEQESVITD